tara:strand:- start:1382 stop:1777 length:396 start_codon:yes stop_codon:yes gene_type:complete
MFGPITIPYDSVMLSNVVKLKEGVTMDDVELSIGELCSVVKDTYGNEEGGFIAGQVFEYSGFVSKEGSFDHTKPTDDHILIVTYWKSFDHHEKSHADKIFKEKFSELGKICSDTYELGYKMLWQGVPEEKN